MYVAAVATKYPINTLEIASTNDILLDCCFCSIDQASLRLCVITRYLTHRCRETFALQQRSVQFVRVLLVYRKILANA